MKLDGVKKIHLGLSILIYLFLISILNLAPPPTDNTDVAGVLNTLLGRIFILLFSLVSLVIGLIFLVYYIIKKDKLMAKLLSISNMLPLITYSAFQKIFPTPEIDSFLFDNVLFILLLVFTFYLYWSREK
jgi:hypothetical protein